MSIGGPGPIPGGPGDTAGKHVHNGMQSAAAGGAGASDQAKFEHVLNDIAKEVLPAEEMAKSEEMKRKKVTEIDAELQDDESDQEESIYKKVQKIKKTLKKLSEIERNNLGI
jgi:hypothetical protein